MRYIATLIICLLTAFPAVAQDMAKPSAAKRFLVMLEAPEKPTGINIMHNRVLRVTNPEGQAIADAKIGVDGGMPAHGHGLPTSPQVTQHLGDGRYLIEGLRFNMSGKWQLKFSIDAAGQRDTAIIDFVLR